jgi:hypothetical protein
MTLKDWRSARLSLTRQRMSFINTAKQNIAFEVTSYTNFYWCQYGLDKKSLKFIFAFTYFSKRDSKEAKAVAQFLK